MKWNSMLSAVLLALGMGTGMARAQDSWEWAITPYVFLPSLDLDATVAGQTVPVDMDFGDVLDTFDVVGLSLRGEAWHGAWGVIGDVYWVDLEAEGGPNNGAKVNIEEWYVDTMAGYRWLMPTKFTRSASMDVTLGLRFHSLEQRIGTENLPRDLGGSTDWVDVMIGARYIRPMSETWLFSLRGDIGGFDLSDAALNYSATGGVAWEFTRDWLLDIGYRVYGIDVEDGQGADNFGLDGIEHGLWLGVSYAPRAK